MTTAKEKGGGGWVKWGGAKKEGGGLQEALQDGREKERKTTRTLYRGMGKKRDIPAPPLWGRPTVGGKAGRKRTSLSQKKERRAGLPIEDKALPHKGGGAGGGNDYARTI